MKNKFALLLTFLILTFNCYSKNEVNLNSLNVLSPRNIGPSGMSGRVTAIDVNLSNKDEIIVGTASGGLWHSSSGGIDWKPLFDEQGTLSIGAVTIQQNNPDVIWVGTGESNPRNSQSSGKGLYKSLDRGRTWQHLGLEHTRNIRRIIIHKDNPEIVYVGVQGSAWADSDQRGVYKTIDGGKNWEKILYINESTGVAEMIVDPVNPNKIFVAMWEFRREPWFFKSGGVGSGIYYTLDGGENWVRLTSDDGLPKGELGRIGLAISKSKPDILYALIEAKKNAMYKSTNGGFNWFKTTEENIGGRPFYYAEIYVDPLNENRVYNIHSVVDWSEDGGYTFKNLLPYSPKVHPDHHAWWIDPDNSNFIIDGNDGGLAISKDMGKSWRFIENLPVAQFYHINIDNAVPYNVYGGMQDNGSWRGPSRVWQRGGIRNHFWQELMFGDGFDVVPDKSNPRYGYAMWQEGNLGRYDLETGAINYIKPVEHIDTVPLRFHWNSGILHDVVDKQTIYFGSQFLHKSTDRGENWQIISPDLTTNNPEKLRQDSSGGLTFDVTGAENHCTIISIAQSEIQSDIIWVGTDDGNIQVTTDGGKSWTNTSNNIKGVTKGSWIAQVHASFYDEAEAFAVINNYRRGDWSAYLLHTSDFGKTWNNILAGKDFDSYSLSFIQDSKEENLMFLGMEFGLYFSLDKGKSWQKWDKNYPSVPTIDLKIHKETDDLVIGTFGRAAWIIDNISVLRELAKNKTGILKEKIRLFSVPDAYLAVVRQADGTRFAGDAIYKGKNLPYGAMITLNVNPSLSDSNNNKFTSKDSIRLEYYSDGKLIRKYHIKSDSNLMRTYWDLRYDGVRNPNKQSKDNEDLPSGLAVLPGKYRLVAYYLDSKDSIDFEVKSDPRMDYNIDDAKSIIELHKSIDSVNIRLGDALDKLSDAKKRVELFEKIINDLEPADKDTLLKLNKGIKEKIESIYENYRGKSGLKGIVRRKDLLSNNIGSSSWYLQSAYASPNSTHRAIIEKTKKQLIEFIDLANDFIIIDWSDYLEYFKKTNLDLFKTIDKIDRE